MDAGSADLEQVLSYIASQNPPAAANVAERIDRTIEFVADFPYSGRLNPDTGAREWVVRGLPLLVIYVVEGPTVRIIALFHTSRDPPSAKRRP